MPAVLDFTGKTFGRLSIIGKNQERNEHGKIMWVCFCDPKLGGCGKTILAQSSHLSAGTTRSCGCLAIDVTKATNTKHGFSQLPEHKIWKQMIDRCSNAENSSYRRYGGRGIVVCEEWRNSFETFYCDMGPRPTPDHSIERKENDKGYFKDNCHWGTKTEQANNRSSNVFYEYNGERKTLPDWCRQLGLNYTAVEQRIRVLDMSFEKAINQPFLERSKYTYQGKAQNLGQWCKELRLNYNTIDRRIRVLGMSFEEAISFQVPTGKTPYTHMGESKPLIQWCRELNLTFATMFYRLCRGWKFEEAIQSIENKEISYSTSGDKIHEEVKTLEAWCDLLDLDKDKSYLRMLRGESFETIVSE